MVQVPFGLVRNERFARDANLYVLLADILLVRIFGFLSLTQS